MFTWNYAMGYTLDSIEVYQDNKWKNCGGWKLNIDKFTNLNKSNTILLNTTELPHPRGNAWKMLDEVGCTPFL